MYFFGAGAEVSFSICDGMNFAKSILGVDCDELNIAIKDYYDRVLDENSELRTWYPSFHNTKFKEEKIYKASIRKKYISENNSISKNRTSDIIKAEIENSIKSNVPLEDKYISYMGIIDENFHTLISPKILGPQKFWRVVNCYTRAYCKILGEMNSAKANEDYLRILNNPSMSISIMKDYADSYYYEESYYKVLRDFKNVNVITTNYTTLCENIANKQENEIAYVHGKFGWFESAKELTVYDISEESLPNDVLFPYIFIQSGVKPIVDEKQLLEYGKMLKFINNSKVIFVLGFNLNIDDNHINSLLKSAIRKNKRIIIFNYENSLIIDDIYYALRLSKEQESKVEFVKINKKIVTKNLKNILVCIRRKSKWLKYQI